MLQREQYEIVIVLFYLRSKGKRALLHKVPFCECVLEHFHIMSRVDSIYFSITIRLSARYHSMVKWKSHVPYNPTFHQEKNTDHSQTGHVACINSIVNIGTTWKLV